MTDAGGPWRELTMRVIAHAGTLVSPASDLIVRAPTITAVTGAGGTYDSMAEEVTLDWFQTADNGVEQTKVYHNTVNNFGTATLISTQTKAAGEAATYVDPQVLGSGDHYYYITAYDPTVPQESAPVGLMITV
jgi:hypothetical protein